MPWRHLIFPVDGDPSISPELVLNDELQSSAPPSPVEDESSDNTSASPTGADSIPHIKVVHERAAARRGHLRSSTLASPVGKKVQLALKALSVLKRAIAKRRK
ncbi:hypothetical protein T484DRAFT_1898848 [Baffinella frigidus]|nr:hypothetical protein T484DRAFT_1898848 [Cryptophyta sp. CCMP2293]|mmetsp:Transcript_14139/g.32913  ORF Transcript_14139/g.32913 Transcript_14139/m.32913 type:complete len:103 (+) Transcript_14139:307-615(+)